MPTTTTRGAFNLREARDTSNKLVNKLGGMVDIMDALADAQFPIRGAAFEVLVDATRAMMKDAESTYEGIHAALKAESDSKNPKR